MKLILFFICTLLCIDLICTILGLYNILPIPLVWDIKVAVYGIGATTLISGVYAAGKSNNNEKTSNNGINNPHESALGGAETESVNHLE